MKKIEGQDIMGNSKVNFEQKINKLKSKPNQKVLEDEYIKVFLNIISGPSVGNKVFGVWVKVAQRQINHVKGRSKRIGQFPQRLNSNKWKHSRHEKQIQCHQEQTRRPI